MTRKKKSTSRPARWQDAVARAEAALEELEALRQEYEDWKDNLPEGLDQSALADKLEAVVEIDFDYAIEIVGEAEAADLPLGFGRD